MAEAAARAARNLGRFEEAARRYGRVVEDDPARWTARVGWASSLVEAGAWEEARDQAHRLATHYGDQPQALLGAAYVHRRRGAGAAAWGASGHRDYLAAVMLYDRLLERVPAGSPQASEARRLRALTLADLGAPGLALEDREAPLQPAEALRLAGDRAAQAVRWGELPPQPGEPFAETDRALTLLQDLLEVAPAGSPARRRTRLDRLLALHQRHRMEEVVAEAADLETAGVTLPPWAAAAVASGHLALGEPERAAELYERLVTDDPDHWNAQVGLFFSRVEAERFPAALGAMAFIARDTPPWQGRPAHPAFRRLEADTLLALGHAFYGDLETAQAFFEPAAARAPFNLDLQENLGTVYRWRGWPRRALATARIATARIPRARSGGDGRREPPVSLALLQAAARLDLSHMAQAQREIDRLLTRNPENRHVQDLHRRWQLDTGWEVYLDALGADSRGTAVDANPLGTSDRSAELFIHAPALPATRWRARPFLHLRSSEATFRGGDGEHRRLGLGLGWRGKGGWQGRVEVHGDVSGREDEVPGAGEDDLGLALGLSVPLGDRWSVAAEVDTESPQVPLQARRAGIGGEGTRLTAAWRASEGTRVAVAVGRGDFDDGNRRRSGLLTAERLWRVTPRWRLSSNLELSTSDNSRLDAPYFNPREDSTAHAEVIQDFLAWRRYDHRWTHRLVVGAGSYWQRGFGSAAIWTARYEHDWNLGSGLGLRYGVLWSSRVYDGDREERTGWLLTSLWRF